MPETPPKFFLTTPIYYVNARPHIGHAYTTIVGDVLARRSRAQGIDTFFLTGTDEHGQKIERSAQAAGIPPQQFTDQVAEQFRTLWQRMGITNDDFIRTTEPRHTRGAQKLFADLHAAGHIYLSTYTGQYSIGEEMFVEGPPGTIGPDGRPTETVTEENFFFRLSNFQLPLINLIESNTLKIHPESSRNEVLAFLRGNVQRVLTLRRKDIARAGAADYETPEWFGLEEESPSHDYSLDVEAFRSRIDDGTLKLSRLKTPYIPGALRDLSVSRSSFTWGIPIPEPAASEASQKHVIYVWLDALANYMTAIGYGSDAPEDQAKFQKYWPANLHLVGKEITRFHCVYWPAFLLAAGLPIPKEIIANGWLLFDNSKMSKSKGNIVRTETILDAFGALCPPPISTTTPPVTPTQSPVIPTQSPVSPSQSPVILTLSETEGKNLSSSPEAPPTSPTPHQRDLFAADVLRYYLLREIPFGQDGSFSFEALITRYNADLANGYGNLVSRTLNMINQYFGGQIPEVGLYIKKEIFPIGDNLLKESSLSSTSSDLTRTVTSISRYVAALDGNLSERAPWKLAQRTDSDSRKDLEDTLYQVAESIRIITALLYPILPYATAAVWAQLGLGSIEEAAKNGDLKNLTWGGLKPGTKLGPLAPIFPRADKGLAQIMTDMETEKTIPAPETTSLTGQRFEAPAEEHVAPTHPAAGPRTSTLAEPNPGAQVAGSTAHTTERPGTPSHTEAPASIFAHQPADSSPQITIDDFAKVELRVAQILVCERIPKADKLLRLEVDLGYERRQILSGIAEWYTPEELIGRRIVVITNLAPRKMRGLESHGMLLAASAEPSAEGEKPGKPHLATFAGADSEALPLGSRLK